MGFNIVLIEPEIPMNTGNIGRLSLASGSTLHLVKPLGFELDNAKLKRAGLDYWQHLALNVYDNIEDFFSRHKNKNMVFLTSKAKNDYYAIDFEDEMFLVFGKESVGLDIDLINKNIDKTYSIPMFSPNIRSLNLANAVSIVVYEGIRNLKQ